MSEALRRLQHQNRSLAHRRGEARGLWNDSASQHVEQRYLRPHEDAATAVGDQLERHVNTLGSVTKEHERSLVLAAQATDHFADAGDFLDDAGKEIRTSFEHTDQARRTEAEAAVIQANALKLASEVGSCCDGCVSVRGFDANVSDYGAARLVELQQADLGMSETGAAALAGYTSNDEYEGGEKVYQAMNRLLDSGTIAQLESSDLKDRLAALMTELDRAGTPHEGTVYRGTDLPNVEEYQPGAVITQERFTSTSTSPQVAQGFTRNAFMVIQSTDGRYVDHASSTMGEREVILNYGARLMVTSVKPANGHVVINAVQL